MLTVAQCERVETKIKDVKVTNSGAEDSEGVNSVYNKK